MTPGGWIELQDVDGQVHCDDGSLPNDWPLVRFCNLLVEAFGAFGTNAHAASFGRQYLEEAGFVNIRHNTVKLPYGPWPKDKSVPSHFIEQRGATLSIIFANAHSSNKDFSRQDTEGSWHVLPNRMRGNVPRRRRPPPAHVGLVQGGNGGAFCAVPQWHEGPKRSRIWLDALLEWTEAAGITCLIRSGPWVIHACKRALTSSLLWPQTRPEYHFRLKCVEGPPYVLDHDDVREGGRPTR